MRLFFAILSYNVVIKMNLLTEKIITTALNTLTRKVLPMFNQWKIWTERMFLCKMCFSRTHFTCLYTSLFQMLLRSGWEFRGKDFKNKFGKCFIQPDSLLTFSRTGVVINYFLGHGTFGAKTRKFSANRDSWPP